MTKKKAETMFLKSYSRLFETLKISLVLNASRAEVMAAVILSAISAKSVLLTSIVSRLPGKAKNKSKYRRTQNFFLQTELNYELVALFILKLLGKLLPEKLTLSLDRTNWRARGNEVNLLVLSVCLGDVAVPILWENLGYKGNSNTRQRKRILRHFSKIFGYDKIACLLADREFVGGKWFNWLQNRNIPYVIRLKENYNVITGGGRTVEVKNLFRNLKIQQERNLGNKKICGAWHNLSAVRLPKNEFVILASWGLDEDKTAVELYCFRWNIETCFEKLKSHGFNLEDTRIDGEGKHEIMFAALSIALAWCYSTGEWSAREVEPIRLKKHGRRERSIFGRGLDELMSLFMGSSCMLRHLSLIVFGILQRGLMIT